MRGARARVLAATAALLLVHCTKQDIVQDAVLLASQGEEGKAITLLEAYLREHPNATRERQLLVRLHASLGNMGKAEQQVMLLAQTLGEHDPTPWLELGHALELQHRYDEALEAYDRAAAVAPRDATGPRVGGLRAARWGEMELAAERLTEALRRNPRDASVWHAWGVVELSRGNPDAARKAYENGLIADPESAPNHLGLATVALQQRAYAVALHHYDELVRLRPTSANAHLGRSWALIMLGRHQQARVELGRAQALGGDPKAIRAQLDVLQKGIGMMSQNPQKPPQNR
ncbi:MAG TPA: tetratricopeptide repeat protein [Polyangiaceae bacterium]|nr:tetratricopeptide repeat protein [Polyangiaceae bacterium]